MAKREVGITAVWLRRDGPWAKVLVEIDGQWRLAIVEHADGRFSHIAEGNGVRHWLPDDTTAPTAAERKP